MDVFILWEKTLETLRKEMHQSAFDGLRDLFPIGITGDDRFQLALPTQGNSSILRVWLEKNYSPRINMILSDLMGKPIRMELIEPFKDQQYNDIPPVAPPAAPVIDKIQILHKKLSRI